MVAVRDPRSTVSESLRQDLDVSPDHRLRMCHLTFDQVFLIYKFIETPLLTLQEGLSTKSEEDVKRYYRSIARQLHPDKNCHPRAKEAF